MNERIRNQDERAAGERAESRSVRTKGLFPRPAVRTIANWVTEEVALFEAPRQVLANEVGKIAESLGHRSARQMEDYVPAFERYALAVFDVVSKQLLGDQPNGETYRHNLMQA